MPSHQLLAAFLFFAVPDKRARLAPEMPEGRNYKLVEEILTVRREGLKMTDQNWYRLAVLVIGLWGGVMGWRLAKATNRPRSHKRRD